MISSRCGWARCLLLVVAVTGCDSGRTSAEPTETFDAAGRQYSNERLVQYALPKALREASGLDLSASGTLLSHGDERARVFEINYIDGTAKEAFRLGEPPVRDDFEGIASANGVVYLVTSTGIVYEAGSGPGAVRGYTRHDAKLPCEIEGLAPWGDDGLVALCKQIYDGDDVLRGYRWSISRAGYDDKPLFSLEASDFHAVAPDLKKLRPSGITFTPTGDVLMVGRYGKHPVVITLDRDFHPVSLVRLPRSAHHTQPEGISLTADGVLLIADEAGKGGEANGRGRLSVYR